MTALRPDPLATCHRGPGDADLVSVAMATWQGAEFVGEQVRSILAQTHRNLELVIADDGSSDGTVEICRELGEVDPRIRILADDGKRQGLVGNFERALRATSGPWIALADQDDVWYPEKIETLRRRLQAAPHAELAFSDLAVVDTARRPISPSMTRYQRLPVRRLGSLRQVLLRNSVTGCATLFRRRLLESALPFPTGCHFHDWWLATVAAARGALSYVDVPLLAYRQHTANTIGVSGSGIHRVRRVLRSVEEASDPRRYRIHEERLESYRSRPDVFGALRARRDLDWALAFTRAMARLEELPVSARARVLTGRLRYLTRPTPTDALLAVVETLMPAWTRRLARALQRRFRRAR